jgi:uncharacterized protein YacL
MEIENIFYPVFLPGEKIYIYLTEEGRQNNQAVGYYDSRTMVVAVNGRQFMNKYVKLIVLSSRVTSEGKIIFGKIISE